MFGHIRGAHKRQMLKFFKTYKLSLDFRWVNVKDIIQIRSKAMKMNCHAKINSILKNISKHQKKKVNLWLKLIRIKKKNINLLIL
jgi:Mg2+/Co2+ transporter CorB